MFFLFKQKTAYEVRISDWSSDVCSSDLDRGGGGVRLRAARFVLADPEDGRTHAAHRAHPGPAAGAGGGGVHGAGQCVAAVPGLADHGALVREREFLVAGAGAAAGIGECVRADWTRVV